MVDQRCDASAYIATLLLRAASVSCKLHRDRSFTISLRDSCGLVAMRLRVCSLLSGFSRCLYGEEAEIKC